MLAAARPVRVVVPLAVAAAAYPLLPSGVVRDLGYQTVGLLALAAACWGLDRRVAARWGWLLVLGGFLGRVVAHSVATLGVHLVDADAHPGPVDAVHLVSCAAMASGLLLMVPRPLGAGGRSAVLDATVLASGLALLVAVLLVDPIVDDGGLSVAGALTRSAYPAADVLLAGLLVVLWTAPGTPAVALRPLTAAVAVTVLGDVLHDWRTVVDSGFGSPTVEEVLWLTGYVLAAGAAWTTVRSEPVVPAPGHVELIAPRRRLVVLTAGMALPGTALVVDGVRSDAVDWRALAAGSLVVSVLVAIRLGGLLRRGEDQAVALGDLARADPLTRIPNLRTWEFELARATSAARRRNAPLTVALLDLDDLHGLNEAEGHAAGDRLLQESAEAWSGLLQPGQVLARYGGDEFALLCPGLWADDVRPMVETLRAATPRGRSICAGIATWDPAGEPASVMATAAQFLTDAKRSGPGQVHVAPRPTSQALIPRPSMLWQPIVDLRTTRPVGVEALSRFPQDDPRTVFEAAAGVGSGPTLEAVAITYALTNRPSGLWVAVNVSLEALGSVQVQRALAGNLDGVVLELTEHAGSPVSDLAGLVQDYRDRGAFVAVDDWGPSLSTLDRLVTLRPDIVKLDVSRVAELESDRSRASIRLVTAWAESVDAMVCAEGVETEEQWRQLCDLGVELGQGHFFGRPMPAEELLALPRDTVPRRLASPVAPRRLR